MDMVHTPPPSLGLAIPHEAVPTHSLSGERSALGCCRGCVLLVYILGRVPARARGPLVTRRRIRRLQGCCCVAANVGECDERCPVRVAIIF